MERKRFTAELCVGKSGSPLHCASESGSPLNCASEKRFTAELYAFQEKRFTAALLSKKKSGPPLCCSPEKKAVHRWGAFVILIFIFFSCFFAFCFFVSSFLLVLLSCYCYFTSSYNFRVQKAAHRWPVAHIQRETAKKVWALLSSKLIRIINQYIYLYIYTWAILYRRTDVLFRVRL